MAITHVQDGSKASINAGSSVSCANFGANPTVGNYVVAFVWGYKSGVTSGAVTCADTTGANTYTQIAYKVDGSDSSAFCCFFYAKIGTSGASFHVTASLSTVSSLSVCAAELSGVASSGPVDGAAVTSTSSSGNPAPGSTTFTSTSAVLAVMTRTDGSGSVSITTPAGYVLIANETDASNFLVGGADYAIAPTMPTNPTWNNPSANSWAASMFALLAASAPAAAAPPPYQSRWRRNVRRRAS